MPLLAPQKKSGGLKSNILSATPNTVKPNPAYANVEFRFLSFDEFFAELGPRPEGHSVDRIDPLGHYEPGNVRWATVLEQAANRMPRNYWKK